MNKKGISVVIPNYNGSLLLPMILPFLYSALENSKLPYEVIVVDDCSTDNSFDILQANYTEIILLKNEINKGFSPTINKGIFIAQYDYLLMLNSDVKLSNNYFENLLPYFDDKDTFGIMGRIIGWDNDKIQDGGKYPSMQGVKIKTSVNYIPIESKKGDRFYSMYLSGANAFVSRDKIIALGGFNELFAPFYVEDVDLSLRAWRMGWKCYYEHNAICRHKTSTTIKSKDSKKFVKTIYYRNKMFLHAIHLSGKNFFIWHLQLIPEIMLHLFTGRWWFFAALKMYLLKRSQILNESNIKKYKKNNIIQLLNDISNSLKNSNRIIVKYIN